MLAQLDSYVRITYTLRLARCPSPIVASASDPVTTAQCVAQTLPDVVRRPRGQPEANGLGNERSS
jgi:hypothetical protein